MADNYTANPGSGGDTFAAADIGGVKFARVKLTLGAGGVNDGDVSAANPVPIFGVVSGAVTANAGSGTMAVSGPLTDAQLRAGAVPITKTDSSASGNITTQNLVPAGAATANSAVEISAAGKGTFTVQVTGTYTGVLSIQARVGAAAAWVTLSGASTLIRDTGVYSATIPSAGVGIWQGDCCGFIEVRVTALAAVTGTAVVSIRTTDAVALVALDTPLPAGTAAIGSVTVSTVTAVNSSTPVTPTTTFTNSAASVNATNTKASAGTVWSVTVSNINAAARYMKLYNLATAPTVGTSVPVIVLPIPIGGVVQIHGGSNGIRFATGIAWALTALAADSDTTVVGAGEHKVAVTFT